MPSSLMTRTRLTCTSVILTLGRPAADSAGNGMAPAAAMAMAMACARNDRLRIVYPHQGPPRSITGFAVRIDTQD